MFGSVFIFKDTYAFLISTSIYLVGMINLEGSFRRRSFVITHSFIWLAASHLRLSTDLSFSSS